MQRILHGQMKPGLYAQKTAPTEQLNDCTHTQMFRPATQNMMQSEEQVLCSSTAVRLFCIKLKAWPIHQQAIAAASLGAACTAATKSWPSSAADWAAAKACRVVLPSASANSVPVEQECTLTATYSPGLRLTNFPFCFPVYSAATGTSSKIALFIWSVLPLNWESDLLEKPSTSTCTTTYVRSRCAAPGV